ncbi:putative ABC transport system permease protein [Croceifilum oryzae]|uniref:ABC transport system permease protein n=1 Tax=Croceifilum oryzae TaxID=1553429 RepID=A0AAJ1TJ70_9BACL|nr:ABC transporter permease [Croceifilum oryzae]MDQ0416974.1 putative ABC transport system permease protein [Croceifilum oryzae]
MNFRQFALNNVKRNARAYSAYFLSSSFSVMIFFTYAMFLFHPDIAKSSLGHDAKLMMKAAEYVIFLFSFIFVLYSNSAFLKVRKKEFGLLTILGSESSQLKRLIFLENMIIGLASIITGIVCGILLSRLFLLFGASVVEIEELSMYLPWKAMGLTAIAFLALFLVVSLLTQFFVRQNQVLDLLQGTSKPKPEPKASIWLSILSVSSFVGAAYLMTQKISESTVLYIFILGMIGTYFFFTQLSVWIIRLFKKNRAFTWRGTNLLWVSEMAYKMKDNARMFFMITIVIAMSCSVIGIVLSVDQQGKRILKEDPFALTYMAKSKKDSQAETNKIDQELKSASVSFEKIELTSTRPKFREIDSRFAMIKQSDYKHLEKFLQMKKLPNLQLGEAFVITDKLKNTKQLTLANGKETLRVVDQFEKIVTRDVANLIIVSDATYNQLKSFIKEKESFSKKEEDIRTLYFVPEWSNAKLPDSNSLELNIGKKLIELTEGASGEGWNGFLSSRAVDYVEFRQFKSMIIFIGVFIASIFSLSTASFLYFKLYTELNQDRHIAHGLSKIGLSEKEMKRSATIQISVLFFLPMLATALETIIGLETLKSQLSLGDTLIPTLTGIGAFSVAQFVYFLIVRARYLNQLKRVMV